MPEGLTALDLDVIKLTAQFVARNGRAFLTGLAQREAANPQVSERERVARGKERGQIAAAPRADSKARQGRQTAPRSPTSLLPEAWTKSKRRPLTPIQTQISNSKSKFKN